MVIDLKTRFCPEGLQRSLLPPGKETERVGTGKGTLARKRFSKLYRKPEGCSVPWNMLAMLFQLDDPLTGGKRQRARHQGHIQS